MAEVLRSLRGLISADSPSLSPTLESSTNSSTWSLAIPLSVILPAVLILLSRAPVKQSSPKSARRADGKDVPLDVERRKAAETADAKSGINRQLQLLCCLALVVPYIWAFTTQTGPTASEQLRGWWDLTKAQLTDGRVNTAFQLATGLLFIERLCYTWVHSFSAQFVNFCSTPLGRLMGKKPLDVVLTIFYLNKVIQLGTFLGFYFYVLDFSSPFSSGWALRDVTRLQWVALVEGLLFGQGLNVAIYRAIGKSGVYYGYRLGESVPWCTGFPFNAGMPHPQYLGVCLTVIGVNVFTATEAHLRAGWLSLTAMQVLFYMYMAFVEDYL